ncbi:MAG: hypothetical protein JSV20_02810 [Candidatus Bathyarchaeota archaeon]|nr:MAG: hypothetical protein JSV20_02810 [Candidatus Bathyarchaeota archaeon]
MSRRLVWEEPSDLIKLLRKQRDMEMSHVAALKPTMEAIADKLVSTLLESIIYDSRKHAAFCKILIDLETGVMIPEMDVGDAIDMAQAIEEHIEAEAEMIKRLEAMLLKTEDDRSKGILNYMLTDERRHHNALKKMAVLFSQSETPFEDYLNVFEKYMYPGPNHSHKAPRF